MIVFDPKHLQGGDKFSANHQSQFNLVKNARMIDAANAKMMVANFGEYMLPQQKATEEGFALQGNAGKAGLDFWRETDRTTKGVLDNDQGREFLTDLMGLAVPLNIGKTSRAYAIGTDVAKDVQRSMDFKIPTSHDHTEVAYDSDPIPTFTAGYGVNFRQTAGQLSEGIDIATDAQSSKMKFVLSNVADYMLTGDSSIKVDGQTGQGIKNHRNTKKINVGPSGFNVDLVGNATTNDAIFMFWTRDFIKQLDDNYVNAVDVLWVSPQIMTRLNVAYSASGGFKEGTLKDYVERFTSGRIKNIRQTFKLSGNEFFAYVRDKEFIAPLVGAALAVVPIARTTPVDNYNFMIYGAMGLQIKADTNGRSGVFYGANLG